MIKKIVKALGFTLLVLLLVFGVYIAMNSGDIPPPDVSDLEVPYPDIPDSENAYHVYREVVPELEFGAEVDEVLQAFPEEKVEDVQAMEKILDQLERPLQRIGQAARMERCVFPRPQSINAMIPEVTGFLSAGKLWSLEVRLALQQDDPVRAAEAAEDLIRVGKSVLSEPETLIQYLVGTAVLSQGLYATELILQHPVVKADTLKQLQHQLVMQALLDRSLELAMKSEYRFSALTIQHLLRERPDEPSGLEALDISFGRFFPGYVLKPNTTRLLFAEYYRQGLPNIGKPYSEMVLGVEEEILPELQRARQFPPPPNLAGMLLGSIMLPAVDGVYGKYSQLLGQLRALQTVCALRRYEQQEGGLPSELSSLVPRYLDEVPADSFDGLPLRYDPERRLIWLIGMDLVDQNGSTAQRPGTRQDIPRNQEDWVWKLEW